MKISRHPFLLGRPVIEGEAEAIVRIVVVGSKELDRLKTLLSGDRWTKAFCVGFFQRLWLARLYFEFNMKHKHDHPHQVRLNTSMAVWPITLS